MIIDTKFNYKALCHKNFNGDEKLMADENKNVPFWQKNWFAWLSFILFVPVGLFIMYTTREDYPTRWKIGAGLSLIAIIYGLTTGEFLNSGILGIVVLGFIGVLLDNGRKWLLANDEEEVIQRKKNIKNTLIALAAVAVLTAIIRPSSEELKENERIAAMNDSEKQIYEQKFTEYTKSMEEDDARTKAIADVDAYTAANEKLAAMNDEEKALYEQKFAAYQATMDDISARDKAIEDVESEIAAKKKALQEMYDKQEQYEKWLAQKKEQEEKALAEKKIQERRNEQKYWLLSPDGFKATNYHVEDEVWVCDWVSKRNDIAHIGDPQSVDGNIYAVYYLPSSKKYKEHGVVFKDPGYDVDVIEKIDGIPVHWFTLQFWKNDDKWKYRISTRRDISKISQWLKPEDFDLSKTINYFEIGESIYQYDRFPGYDQPWGDIVEDENLKLLVREKFIESGIDAATVDKYIENMSEANWIKCVFYATHTIADDVKK